MNLLQPLNDRNAVQLRNALRSAAPGSIKVGLRSMRNGWRAMVVVQYQHVPFLPDAKPYRRWFKLCSVSIGYDDDPERPTRMAAILAEAEAVVETERARLAAHEAKK